MDQPQHNQNNQQPQTPMKTPEQMKADNDALEAEIIRKEKLAARAQMGGAAIVSIPTPEVPAKEKHKAFWKGTQIEKAIDKYG